MKLYYSLSIALLLSGFSTISYGEWQKVSKRTQEQINELNQLRASEVAIHDIDQIADLSNLAQQTDLLKEQDALAIRQQMDTIVKQLADTAQKAQEKVAAFTELCGQANTALEQAKTDAEKKKAAAHKQNIEMLLTIAQEKASNASYECSIAQAANYEQELKKEHFRQTLAQEEIAYHSAQGYETRKAQYIREQSTGLNSLIRRYFNLRGEDALVEPILDAAGKAAIFKDFAPSNLSDMSVQMLYRTLLSRMVVNGKHPYAGLEKRKATETKTMLGYTRLDYSWETPSIPKAAPTVEQIFTGQTAPVGYCTIAKEAILRLPDELALEIRDSGFKGDDKKVAKLEKAIKQQHRFSTPELMNQKRALRKTKEVVTPVICATALMINKLTAVQKDAARIDGLYSAVNAMSSRTVAANKAKMEAEADCDQEFNKLAQTRKAVATHVEKMIQSKETVLAKDHNLTAADTKRINDKVAKLREAAKNAGVGIQDQGLSTGWTCWNQAEMEHDQKQEGFWNQN